MKKIVIKKQGIETLLKKKYVNVLPTNKEYLDEVKSILPLSDHIKIPKDLSLQLNKNT